MTCEPNLKSNSLLLTIAGTYRVCTYAVDYSGNVGETTCSAGNAYVVPSVGTSGGTISLDTDISLKFGDNPSNIGEVVFFLVFLISLGALATWGISQKAPVYPAVVGFLFWLSMLIVSGTGLIISFALFIIGGLFILGALAIPK